MILQRTVISDVMKLLERNRPLIDIRPSMNTDHQWCATSPDELSFVTGTEIYGDRAIFPHFSFKSLKEETKDEKLTYVLNNQELYAIAFW